MPENTVIDLLKTLQWVRARRNAATLDNDYSQGFREGMSQAEEKISQMLDSHAVSAKKFAEQVQTALREVGHG
jgi:flagellar biosynthesis/type III secretory pathway protein FliH